MKATRTRALRRKAQAAADRRGMKASGARASTGGRTQGATTGAEVSMLEGACEQKRRAESRQAGEMCVAMAEADARSASQTAAAKRETGEAD